MMYETAQFDHFDADDTMGAWYDAILGTATQAGIGLGVNWLQNRNQPSGAGNCLVRQVRGDEAMSNCAPRVLALFDELEIMAPTLSTYEVIVRANQIAGIPADNFYFDQNIGGNSETVRETLKVQARQRADAIIAQAQAVITAAGGSQQQAGTSGTKTIGGFTIDTQTVLIAGGGLFLLLFLLKN